jgi:type IV secretion system protein VirB10
VKVAHPKAHYLKLVGAAIGVFVVLWLMFGQSEKHVRMDQSETTKVDDQSSLNQAEQKMHSAPNTPSMMLPPLSEEQAAHLQAISNGPASISDMEQQAFKARMNQPSLIYGNGKGATSASQSVSGLNNNDSYSNFANSQATVVASVPGQFLKHPEWTILQGEVLHATLDVALNSDLPGMLTATLSSPVYAYTSDKMLLPKGSRLMGQYSTQMDNGMATSRIFIMWNRIVTPDGLSMMINSPGVDSLGQAGAEADDIQRHLVAIFGSGVIYSILGGAAATVGVNGSTQNNSANQLQANVAQGFTQTAQKQLQSAQSIKSTLQKYQGSVIDVMVSHDVDLYSALASKNTTSGM